MSLAMISRCLLFGRAMVQLESIVEVRCFLWANLPEIFFNYVLQGMHAVST